MKKLFKNVRDIVLAVAIVAMIWGIGYYCGRYVYEPMPTEVYESKSDGFDLKLPGEKEKKVITIDEVESKISEIDELATVLGEYAVTRSSEESRYLLDIMRIWGTKNTITVKCNGIVKVGYNVSQINVQIDDEKIYISLPEPSIYDNYVVWDSVECTEKNSFLNPIEVEQYQQLIQEIESDGLADVESQGIYENAEIHVKKLIEVFLADFVNDGYQIVYM